MLNEPQKIRIAILDLYEGQTNEGMRCIREILNQFGESNNLELEWDEFEVRLKHQLPDFSCWLIAEPPNVNGALFRKGGRRRCLRRG